MYELDWLRVMAILVVFFAHTAKIFDFHTAVMANPERSPVLSITRDLLFLWVMPLFFVISGAAVYLSGNSVRKWEFVKTRFLRLVVPLLLAGTFLVNPVYVYIERLSAGSVSSDFFHWYPRYFDGMYGFGGNFAPLGHGTHLWYLEFLFIFTLILLPLFSGSGGRGPGFLEKLSIRFEKPWTLFMLFLPVSLSAVIFETAGLGWVRGMGGWDPVSYLLFFAFGYLVTAGEKTRELVKRYSPAYLIAALVLTLVLTGIHFGFLMEIDGLTRHDLSRDGTLLPLDRHLWIVFQGARGLAGWCWVVGLLGLGRRFLNFNNRFLAFATEMVLPFYILHHAVIYVAGHYAIQWEISLEEKFLVISVSSFLIIVALYLLLVRRFRFLRRLFGMKVK